MSKYIVHTVQDYHGTKVRDTYTTLAKNAPTAIRIVTDLTKKRKTPEKITKVEKPKSG